VHKNATVVQTVGAELLGRENVHLIEPTDYLTFVELIRAAHLIITDSGGIQEEAPTLGKPVLVTRAETERPEAVEAGAARLVGTDATSIIHYAEMLLDGEVEYERMAKAGNPFGDGQASSRIVASILARGG
jgi:UDP-N-acetylglucosamine 2-epimerase